MKSVSQNRRASNQSFCLTKKLAVTARFQNRFGRSQVWHAHNDSKWSHFELKRVARVCDDSHACENREYQWIGLQSHGEALGWCEMGLAQLASGIAYDTAWPESTRDELMRVATQLWDSELLQAMGGQLQLHCHITPKPEETYGLFELILICKGSKQRHKHQLMLNPVAVLRWLEDSRWQPADMPDVWSSSLWGGLKCHGQWLLGQQMLSLRQARSLQSGDAILLDQSRPEQPPSASWIFGNHIIRWVCSANEIWTFKGMEAMETHPIHETLIGLSTARDAPDDLKHAGRMDDIPVLLTFTAGQVSLAIRELLSLSVGQTIDLKCPASTRVTISTHGQVIGFGELIDIEGRLAVEIISLSALP